MRNLGALNVAWTVAYLAICGCTVSPVGVGETGVALVPVVGSPGGRISAAAEAACVPACTLFPEDVSELYERTEDYRADGLSLTESVNNLMSIIEAKPREVGGGLERAQACLPCFGTVAGEVYAASSPPPSAPAPTPPPSPTPAPSPPPANPPTPTESPEPVQPDNSAPVLSMPADDFVSPSTWVSLSASVSDADDDDVSYAWKQEAGPPVDLGSVTGPLVQFIAPEDVGAEQVIELALAVSDGIETVTGSVAITVVPATVSPFGTEDGHSSSLVIESSSLIHVNTLARQFTQFTVDLTASDGANLAPAESPLFIFVNSLGGADAEVTDMFTYDPLARRLALDPARVNDFKAELDDDLIDLLVGSYDDQGRGVGLVVSFYYGSNVIEGAVVNQAGVPLSSLAGESLTAFSFSVGANRTTVIGADGSFRFDDLPTDVYEITLLTDDGAFGNDVVPILSGGTTVMTEFVVASATGDSSSLRTLGSANLHTPVKRYQDNGSPHRRAPLPEPRTNLVEPEGMASHRLFSTRARSSKIGSSVSATSGAENTKIEDSLTAEIPQGQKTVTLRYRVASAEYPTYTGKKSKFDDKFGFLFTVTSQGSIIDRWRGSGSVNNLHAALAPDGITDWQSKSINVESHTKDHPISVTMRPWAINVGDSSLATTITLKVDAPALVITEFRHVAGLNKGRRQGKTYIGIPRNKSSHTWWDTIIEFRPRNAALLSLTLSLKHGADAIVIDVFDDAFSLGLRADYGKLALDFAVTEGVGLTRPLVEKVSLSLVLKAEVNGKEETSAETLMKTTTGTELVPLYDVGEEVGAGRRYSQRDADLGGDAWARKGLRDWLIANPDIIFNDCSLEHGGPWPIRSNGKRDHNSHRDGVDVDVRYFGGDPPLDSNASGARKQLVTQAKTEYGNPPVAGTKQYRLAEWIKKNRIRMNQIVGDPNVRLLYTELAAWSWKPLVDGKYEDGLDLLIMDAGGDVVPLGKWVGKSAKVKQWAGHADHVHINFYN